MASLIDDLTAVLQQEMEVYQTLIPISEQKTEVLIRGDLKRLQEITDQEQELLDQASAYGHRREEVLHNMGMVLNRPVKDLSLTRPDRTAGETAGRAGAVGVVARRAATNDETLGRC